MDLNYILVRKSGERIQGRFSDGRMIIHGRVANHTKRIGERGLCQYKGSCGQGHACSFGGYFSSNSATLPAAADTGNMTLRPHSIVREVLYEKEKGRAAGVRLIDAQTMDVYEYYAKIIFLNASAMNSAAILLNSVSDAFPEGFGNSSGQIGKNLMDMPYGVGARGRFEGFEDKFTYGSRPLAFLFLDFVILIKRLNRRLSFVAIPFREELAEADK